MLGGRGQQNAVPPRPLYSFPELKSAEILQCMEDLRIPLGEAELAKPTCQIVQRVFEAFAEIFMGVPRDQISGSQPAFRIVESLEHPDLHIDSINLISFYRLIMKLMVEIGIEDFSLRDLIRPEAPRLRLILSAVINFAKFREEQLSVFEEFSRRGEEAAEQRDKLARRQDELTAKIGHIKSKFQQEESTVLALREESAKMLQNLRELKKEQMALSSALEGLKAQKQEASERMAQVQFLLGNTKQECNKLKSRIVHSPEKLLQIIAEMNASITHEKSNLGALEKKSRDLQMKLDSLAELELEIVRTIQGMESLQADLRKKSELINKVREERESIERQQILAKDLAIKEGQMARQLASAQDKLNRLQQNQEERRGKIKVQLKALQDEYQAVADDRNQCLSKIEQSDRLVKDFEMKMSDLRRGHEAEMAGMRSECVALRAKVGSYIEEMKKQIKGSL